MPTTNSIPENVTNAQAATEKPSLCIINYNGEEFLPEVLSAIVEGEDRRYYGEVVFIDNGSDDGSVAIVARLFPSVRIVKLEQNHGPAAARNAALREARSGRVAMIDNDVIPSPGCFRTLNEALDLDPKAVLAMPRILYATHSDTIQYDGAHCHFLGLMALHNERRQLAGAPTETRTIGAVVTACYLIDRVRWEYEDPFDESFFIYLEDLETGIRARAMGHHVLSVSAAQALHRAGTKGLSLRRTGVHTERRVFCTIRNRWQILLIHYQAVTLVLLAPALLLFEAFQFAGSIAKGWLGEWLRAAGWMITHAGEVFGKRRAAQKLRRVPDRDLLMGGRLPFTPELAAGTVTRAGVAVLDGATNIWWRLVVRILPKGAR